MTREEVHDLMENELRCVQRGNYCDRDCAKCPLVKDDKELIEAYGYIIKALEQKPRKGHWLSHKEYCEMNNLRPSGLGSYFWCSECNHAVDVREWHRNYYNYCPNCGADMREVYK